MKRFNKYFILCFMVMPGIAFAQASLKKANKLYDNLSYSMAIPEYLKALKDEPGNSEALIHLANCYRLINDAKNAEIWYAKVAEIPSVNPTYILYYAQALMSNENYAEAEIWISKYRELNGNDERAERMIESLKNINSLKDDSSSFLITNLSVNSDNGDFCPVYYKNGIVFSSSRTKAEIIQRTQTSTGFPFYTIYFAKGKEDKFAKPEIFSSSITTKFNNGPVCFNKAGNEIYVTRNNIEDGKIRKSDSGEVKLKIFILKKSGSDWGKEVAFEHNNDNYNCAHPCISPDGNKLYFTSDMPGGFGGMDIYVSDKLKKGWGTPVNLGSKINTADNDGFPFIDENGGLYFASTGHGGLGGYDIYYCSKSTDGFSNPVNMGYPINTASDDFAIVQNEDGTSGYFTSNRIGKNTNDDIYYFKRMSVMMNVIVYDVKTRMPLPASSLRILEANSQKNIELSSNGGGVKVFLTPGKKYKLIAQNDKYSTDTIDIDADKYSAGSLQSLSIPLQKSFVKSYIAGKIVYNVDSIGIEGVEVRIVNKETGEERTTTTASDGSYRFDNLAMDSRYLLDARKFDCVSMPVEVSTEDFDEKAMTTLNVSLKCVEDVVKLENIYFDLDKYDLRQDAKPELNKIVSLMKSNPDIRIELRSHTDCRGDAKYNLWLSERRAKSAVVYLKKNGIHISRMIAKGYGESKPVNGCECESNTRANCSEEQYQDNRRTEFRILSNTHDEVLSQRKK